MLLRNIKRREKQRRKSARSVKRWEMREWKKEINEQWLNTKGDEIVNEKYKKRREKRRERKVKREE